MTSPTVESQVEAKVVRELFAVAEAKTDEFDALLEKFSYWKTLRVLAWISRFVHNTRAINAPGIKGPLTTKEIDQQRLFWEKRVQESCKGEEKLEEDRLQLNLQENQNGVLECRGRIQGDYPVYLPDNHLYTEKLVTEAHLGTLHGGVGLTMAKVRERHWVPRLRRLTKKIVKTCYGCKRFQVRALASPPPGNLPKDRTERRAAFQVVGIDYAGPLKYRKTKKVEGKAYLALYACSVTRALYLELLPNMETSEFLKSLKRFIARCGRPEKIYSDNGRTFVGAANWLKAVMTDERLNDFVARQGIKWQFNLSHAPWWGGQFERLVGLVKRSLYKSIGNGSLTWGELQEVVLDVEVALNNRPLSYVEDDVQLPVLTPNSLLFDQPNLLPELDPCHLETGDLRKREKHLKRCKDVVWRRWTGEYLRGLRERHRLKHDRQPVDLKVGEVMLIKGDKKNRGKWKIGIVEKLFPGRDGIVRAVRLRSRKLYLERPVQHLFPLELACDMTTVEPIATLNAEAATFTSKRSAAQEARGRIAAIAEEERRD